MDAVGPKILFAARHYWDSPVQTVVHHLARGFVKAGWTVAFVSEPITPFHVFRSRRSQLGRRLSLYRRGGRWALEGKLWAYVPGALLSVQNVPLLRSKWLRRNWRRLTLPNVLRKAGAAGFGIVDVICIESINQSFWLDALPHRLRVYQLGDNNAGDHKYTPLAAARQRELISKVDLVTYAGRGLGGRVAEMGAKKAIHLPNGVDFAHFNEGSDTVPAEYPSIPKPIAVYAGALDFRFDFELVSFAAGRLPHVSFVLIGPDRLARKQLSNRPNVHLLGSRPYAELPAYLKCADVGIIPFDVRRYPALVNSTDPLELY
ncbi:MAG: glycosyltransferase, partial [Phycisphaerae bacterium]|nr:glycosyltransferase [Phycisphaerae bacterium]